MSTLSDKGIELWYDSKGGGQALVLSGGFGLLLKQFDFIRET